MVGIGGSIIKYPMLLFIPSMLGVASFTAHEVAGLSAVQVFFATLAGVWAYKGSGYLNFRLIAYMGGAILVGSLLGGYGSGFLSETQINIVYAILATTAVILMFLPKKEVPFKPDDKLTFNGPLAASLSFITGLAAGIVGAAGAFILVPIMLVVLKIPTRVTIATSLAVTFISSIGATIGKVATDQAFIDKFAKYYTPAIMGMALLVAIVPPLLFGAGWSTWVYQGLAVLVVGCPCALVISTPISIVSAIGNAAKKGILIKGGVYLEEMGRLKAIAFDKTGTLTKGKPVVTDFHLINNQIDENEMLSIITALENRSQHPLASAIINKADSHNVPYSDICVEDFSSITGKGIRGRIDNEMYYIGNPTLFEEVQGSIFSSAIKRDVEMLQGQGKTVMIAGTKNTIQAIIAVADEVRESSKAVIQKLHEAGIEKTVMLTGDNSSTANTIGTYIGVTDIQSDLLPQDKLDVINQLKIKYNHVGMVGDGVNDAPALAASTVGIAMGGAGTDTALETADVALMGDDLKKLPFTIKLSRKTLNIIKANIAFAIGIKLIALLLVIPGWLTLWIAIVSDMGATLIVALNGMRLMRVEEDE